MDTIWQELIDLLSNSISFIHRPRNLCVVTPTGPARELRSPGGIELTAFWEHRNCSLSFESVNKRSFSHTHRKWGVVGSVMPRMKQLTPMTFICNTTPINYPGHILDWTKIYVWELKLITQLFYSLWLDLKVHSRCSSSHHWTSRSIKRCSTFSLGPQGQDSVVGQPVFAPQGP